MFSVKGRENYAGISLVGVSPECQGEGVGRMLLKAVEDLALSEGYQSIVLNAAPSAADFYLRCGFQQQQWQDENVEDWPVESGPRPIPMMRHLIA